MESNILLGVILHSLQFHDLIISASTSRPVPVSPILDNDASESTHTINFGPPDPQ